MRLDLVNSFISWRMKKRFHQIELFMKYPHETQRELLFNLLDTAKNTEWGSKYDFGNITSYEQFQQRVPLHFYEGIQQDVERLRAGEQNIMWPTEIKWFAKSSGTTAGKSKFIPVSQEAIEDCHFKAGKDMLSIYCNNKPETKVFSGMGLRLGGSTYINNVDNRSYYGDVSAIIIENLPFWVEMRSVPNNKISLMEEWEEKLEAMANTTIREDVSSLAGVPSWMLVLARKVLEKTGKDNLHEVWPNLELYMHGGVNFGPYRHQFKKLLPNSDFSFLEIYNASEGFFGIQDIPERQELLLMLDYGIFYEFIPMDQFDGESSPTIPLSAVEEGKNYAIVISSNAGLWRYIIGDTVRFTSIAPYRIQITGRTKHFINAFGEELIIENAESALKAACEATGAEIDDYSAAPVYMSGSSGAHEWLIEFNQAPDDLVLFTEALDRKLKDLNSDYEAKRHKDMALQMPLIRVARENLFYDWLKAKGKLGGQHKVPRLSNNRKHLEEMLKLNTVMEA
jgi:phenylacetate-coenzyme A ligase PaaK-like adenylate-forming protein